MCGIPAILNFGFSRRWGEAFAPESALRSVDFAVGQGEFVAIMGPSGSGKSPLLYLLGGLDTPSEGDVTLAGAVGPHVR